MGDICPQGFLVNSSHPDRVQAEYGRPHILVSSVQDAPPGRTVSKEKRHKKSLKVDMLIPVLSVASLKNILWKVCSTFPISVKILKKEGFGLFLRGPPCGFENN